MDTADVASNHPPSLRYSDTKLRCDKELIVYIVPKHVLPAGISDTTKFQSVFLNPQSSGFVLTSSILNSKNHPPTNFHIYFVSFGLFTKTTSIFFSFSTKSFLPPLKRDRRLTWPMPGLLESLRCGCHGMRCPTTLHSRSARSSNLVVSQTTPKREGQIVGLLVGVDVGVVFRAGVDNIYIYVRIQIWMIWWYIKYICIFEIYLYTVYSPYVYLYMYPVSNCRYPKEEILWSQSGMALKPWPIVG